MKRAAALLALVLLSAAGCDAGPRRDREAPGAAPTSAARPAYRRPVTSVEPKVVNNAFGSSRALVERAVADLRSTGLWDELTGHLAGVRISARPGRAAVPEDGHLADAMLSVRITGRRAGGECDIMFFPTAIDDDRARYATYVAQGVAALPVPTTRELWASVLGHELAHCLGRGRLTSEATARRWERRVLAALRARPV